MQKLLILLFFLPVVALAQQDSVLSGPYKWQQPAVQKNKIASVVLLEGKVHDFEWMQWTANTITGTKEIKQSMAAGQEQMIIVKSGSIAVHFGDSSFLLTTNSVAVLMPGEKYSLKNVAAGPSDFYCMKYSRNSSGDIKKSTAGGSFVKIWEGIAFKPNTTGGGRRDFFERSTAIQKRFEIHVSTLKEGARSHAPHTHRAEEIVMVINGDTEMQIGEKFYSVNAGGFYFLGSNILHAIKTTGTTPSTYFAIQFE